MTYTQAVRSIAYWKVMEARFYREWQRLKKKGASTAPGSKRQLALKHYNHAHQMRVRAQLVIRKHEPAHVSEVGAKKIIEREGLIPYAYLDSQHYPTAWVGHLIQLKRRDLTQADFAKWGSKQHPAPKDKIVKFFREVDLAPYEKVVHDANQARIKAGFPSISDNQFDAAVSLTFNIGTGGFVNSTVAKLIRNGSSKEKVANAFMMWDHPPEIIGRRKTERDQYLVG